MQAGLSSKTTRTEQMPKLIAPVQLPEQSSSQQNKSAVLLRRSSNGAADNSLKLNAKDSSELVVKPDGEVLWAMPAKEPGDMLPSIGGLLRDAATMAIAMSIVCSGVTGMIAGSDYMNDCAKNKSCASSRHLAKTVAMASSSTLAGTVAGLAYAPLLAIPMIVSRLACPAAVLGGCWAAAHGVMAVHRRRRALRPISLLRQLEKAALDGGGNCIMVAEKISRRAAASGRFRRKVVKLGGVDKLLQMAKNNIDADAVQAMHESLLRALAELLKEPNAQRELVKGGGVALLVNGLTHPDADVARYCTEALALLANNTTAQTQIRASIDIPTLVDLLSKSPSAEQQLQLLSMIYVHTCSTPKSIQWTVAYPVDKILQNPFKVLALN